MVETGLYCKGFLIIFHFPARTAARFTLVAKVKVIVKAVVRVALNVHFVTLFV